MNVKKKLNSNMENKNHTFTKVNNELLLRSTILTDADKLTLALILSWIENDKECFMGNDYIGDMLGISKNAASKRILRLEKLGCIQLDYTYKEGKKEVDKRYITFLSYEPKVSPESPRVSPDRLQGISSEEIGYVPTDDTVSPDRIGGVSPKVGGIIQPSLLDNLSNNKLNNLSNNGLNNENSGEIQFEKKRKLRKDILDLFGMAIPEQRLFKYIAIADYNSIEQFTGMEITSTDIELFEEYNNAIN